MSNKMTAEEFQGLTSVSRETLDKLILYAEMLAKWQKSINLISTSTVPDMWLRHFYDSAQLMDYIEPADKPLKILDLGSGAGFPGLVLSILGAGEVHLVEGVGKKCSFMKQIIQQTGINAIVHNERIEDMDAFPVDLITSRACADLNKLLDLTERFTTPQTNALFLKGEKAEAELVQAAKNRDFREKKYPSKSEESGMILFLSEIKGLEETE
mgnify:CR=1 FL=1|tara:strand:+ start:56822 stop:57457 length:636 start_codon:yes stop_codon:yes gene_type:complete